MPFESVRPHVIVLPEDQGLREIALGFTLEVKGLNRIQVRRPCGGWRKVLDSLVEEEVGKLSEFPERLLVLVIDCDGKPDRISQFKAAIPLELQDRVLIVGPANESETLRAELRASRRLEPNSWEAVGRLLGAECRDGVWDCWDTPELAATLADVRVMRERVHPILF